MLVKCTHLRKPYTTNMFDPLKSALQTPNRGLRRCYADSREVASIEVMRQLVASLYTCTFYHHPFPIINNTLIAKNI